MIHTVSQHHEHCRKHMRNNQQQKIGITTGFRDIDLMTQGLCVGNLLVLAGRPCMKQTVFAMNIAEHVAVSEKLPVAVFLLEKDEGQTASRIVNDIGLQDQVDLNNETSHDKQEQSLHGLIKHSGPNDLHLLETHGLSVSALRAHLQQLLQQCGPLGLIVLDRLQLMSNTPPLNEAGNTSDLCCLTQALKLVAMEFQCPLLVLSDLPERIETRTYKRPTTKDLRAWGNIDQIADVIFFIYRDDCYNKNTFNPGIIEITVIKKASGIAGKVRFAFEPSPTQRFLTLSSETDDY
ncbi:hypothetical protein B9Z52_11375 [Limnohabitans sp. Jir72]|nr:hypothetical protein B9Z52_11375 [Limnohabitans sp. Jir72]